MNDSARDSKGEAMVPRETAARVSWAGIALAAAGAALILAAAATTAGRAQLGFGYLVGFTFGWSIVLGSLFFAALQHLTGAVWAILVRRVAEMFAWCVGALAFLFVPIVVFGGFPERFPLFAWLHPDSPAMEHVGNAKRAYLTFPFFTARAALYFALWIGFTLFFVRGSLGQDRAAEPEISRLRAASLKRFSGPFMVVFAFTVTFASFDWLMSLEPNWHSTIFGVYVFAGMAGSALAAITLAAIALNRFMADGRAIKEAHMYTLGALLFAFVCFWAYIAFSQFMLIWYGNIPDEAIYMAKRIHTGWSGFSVALVAVRFVIPFALLLSRRAKSNARPLAAACLLVLIGQILDLYWMIMPELDPSGPVFRWTAIGPLLLLAGVIAWTAGRFMARHPVLPVGDPRIEDARHYHE